MFWVCCVIDARAVFFFRVCTSVFSFVVRRWAREEVVKRHESLFSDINNNLYATLLCHSFFALNSNKQIMWLTISNAVPAFRTQRPSSYSKWQFRNARPASLLKSATNDYDVPVVANWLCLCLQYSWHLVVTQLLLESSHWSFVRARVSLQR